MTASGPFETLSALVAGDLAAVNAMIRARMESEHAPRIPEVTAHLVEAGGKRLRPMLTLAAARLCGYGGEDHVKLAATVEFIHTATLLHDDVVDESDKRRGRPTANLLWDNKSSVLVGDYLFSRSFQLMVETGSLRVLDILANASAVIAEGEVLQLSTANDLSVTEATYLTMIHGKTAALFAAAAQVGGVIADAPERQVEALRIYGEELGMAFQIVDDVLDYGGVSETLGKNVGDDFREGKVTLPVLYAIAAEDEAGMAFWRRVIEKRAQGPGDLEEAVARMRAARALERSAEAARERAARARAALEAFPPSELRAALDGIADFVVSRVR
ncbi:polyprenyl synthetase family protein [Oceanicella actignis]|uniref:Octaprenyl diphosphate synthase n=1 Tax=Oceanicella actignis TaxID=1189325 RepID=A0A1M7TJB7_9RHOB|nr:polyprenyl synthetase family protein [Oceanicella actignis]TYO88154.1 octaprenyl-diphosphate synthase [Oceanicella actignis]SET66125.1 octaprenyl-diphosphate synthase [Oceanicella actignis]SHN70801.1 octaprenyl-diphosphate synthase [Oceanicella actignis]